jgi:hypothetical protein
MQIITTLFSGVILFASKSDTNLNIYTNVKVSLRALQLRMPDFFVEEDLSIAYRQTSGYSSTTESLVHVFSVSFLSLGAYFRLK